MDERKASSRTPGRAAGLILAAVALAGAVTSATAQDAPTIVAVTVDNAKVIRLPESTQTVIVGNPIIADVSLQKNGVLILTGKSFGSTNLIALDNAGAMIAETRKTLSDVSQSVNAFNEKIAGRGGRR